MNESLSCLICGEKDINFWARATDAEYRTTEDAFNYYRCLNCDVLFINPVPSNQLDKIYPIHYYSFSLATKHSVIQSVKNWLDQRIFKLLLKKLPKESLTILDIGGGQGAQLDILRKIDKRISSTYVVDLNKEAEQIALKNGHAYFCGRIEDFVSDVKFDLILLLNLIEHVADPEYVLKKVRSLLSDTGVVLIKTPNYDSLDARLFKELNWGGYHCPRHWVLFTKRSFTRLAEQADLQVKKFSYTQGAPFWATSIMFWLSKKGLINNDSKNLFVDHPLFKILCAIFACFDFLRIPFSKTSQMFFILKNKKS